MGSWEAQLFVRCASGALWERDLIVFWSVICVYLMCLGGSKLRPRVGPLKKGPHAVAAIRTPANAHRCVDSPNKQCML